MFEQHLLSSLVKVFPEGYSGESEFTSATALRGEKFSFQAAFCSSVRIPEPMTLKISGSLEKYTTVHRTGLVYGQNLESANAPGSEDQPFIRRNAGLFPDVLYSDLLPLSAPRGVWRSLWFDVAVPEDCRPGNYTLSIQLTSSEDVEPFPAMEFTLRVCDAVLPPQTLLHTEWFYNDCICQAHGVKAWSPAHWRLLEKYFTNYVSHGANVILTPVFTPPLDTYVGGERMTTQLVGIKKTGKKYTFDFRKFDRWVRLARKCGIRRFEISHLFTQWGAKATPKIVADVNGVEKKIFGWDVASDSPEYKAFLTAFLPALIEELKRIGIPRDDVYFHVSDEPSVEAIEKYKAMSGLVKELTGGYKILDALSHTEFFKQGLVELPVPSEGELEAFLPFEIAERWTYYCCGPVLPYSNRIFSMPASANRVMGLLLYLYKCEGFLHWGYNFWNSGVSRHSVNPLSLEPDSSYPSGDQCLVYPGPEGPLNSLRGEIFFDGLQDMRALQQLESLAGRDHVVRLVDRIAGMEVRMNHFPVDTKFLLTLRDAVNMELESLSKKKGVK